MVAETVEVELERFGLDQITCRQIIDDQMRKIGLTGNRAEGRKLRRSETRNIIRADVGVRNAVENRPVGGTGNGAWAAQLQLFFGHRRLSHGLCLLDARFARGMTGG